MSSKLCGLLSATFVEPGYDHLVELIHQRDPFAHRHLASLDVSIHAPNGRQLGLVAVDPHQEVLDLAALVRGTTAGGERVMVLFDARYDERIFPYRPHHYAYLHRQGSSAPALYYAVNAVLGGVPDRIGTTRINNFETYLFRSVPFAERYSVLLGNLSRFTSARARAFTYYDGARVVHDVALGPKAHAEIDLSRERDGAPLGRVEVKAPFRLATYVLGRHSGSGDLVLFDHLFTYFK